MEVWNTGDYLLRARREGLMEQMRFELCQELLTGESEEAKTIAGCR
jgi:hypothetical protein